MQLGNLCNAGESCKCIHLVPLLALSCGWCSHPLGQESKLQPPVIGFKIECALDRQYRSALAHPTLVSSSSLGTAWVCLIVEMVPVCAFSWAFLPLSGEHLSDFLDEAASGPGYIVCMALAYQLPPLCLVFGVRGLSPMMSCWHQLAATMVAAVVSQAIQQDQMSAAALVAILLAFSLQMVSVLQGLCCTRAREQALLALSAGTATTKVFRALARNQNLILEPADEAILQALIQPDAAEPQAQSESELSDADEDLVVLAPVIAVEMNEVNFKLSSLLGEDWHRPDERLHAELCSRHVEPCGIVGLAMASPNGVQSPDDMQSSERIGLPESADCSDSLSIDSEEDSQ